MNYGGDDWIEDLKNKQKAAQDADEAQTAKRALIGENVAGLWRVFLGYLQSESERYHREIGTIRAQVTSLASEFRINTVAQYPSVFLSVECCGKDGTQFTYRYTVMRNYDSNQEENSGRYIIDSNGKDVFLKTPDEVKFENPKEAATLLLRRVFDMTLYK